MKVQRLIVETRVGVETSRAVNIEGGSVPGISLPRVLSRVLVTSIMFWLREWRISVGLCDYLGQKGGVVMNDWLIEGHGVDALGVLVFVVLGGIPA